MAFSTHNNTTMQTKSFSRFFQALFVLFFTLSPALLAEGEAPVADVASPNAKFYAIAAAVAIGSMSAAYAVGKIGAAVMGAAAEKPEIMSKALPFVALGEGIALFGFLVAIFLL